MPAPHLYQVRITFEAHGMEISLAAEATFESAAALLGESLSELAAAGIDPDLLVATLRDQVAQALPQLREVHESVRLGLMVAYTGLLKEQADSTPAPTAPPAPKGKRK